MMFSCNNVSICRGGREILTDISFSASEHHFTAILGKNGSGKSTLASAMAGLIPYAGEMTWKGNEICRMPCRRRAMQMARLPQDLPCVPLTVRELVGFGRNPYLGVNRRFSEQDYSAVEQAMARVDIGALADRMLPTLSGGERQRAYLAMILAQDTEVLILDEPTAYMDMDAEAKFIRLLYDLSREGKTLFVILHQLSLALTYADNVLVLDKGRAIFAGSKEDCLACNAIEQTFSVSRHVLPDTGELIFTA